jgi:hypothetical protein
VRRSRLKLGEVDVNEFKQAAGDAAPEKETPLVDLFAQLSPMVTVH